MADFRMIDDLSIAVHAFTRRMLTSLSVDEKQSIISLSSYNNKSYTSVVLRDSEATLLGKRRMQRFVHFSIVLCL